MMISFFLFLFILIHLLVQKIKEKLGNHDRVLLTNPLPYPEFVYIMKNSWLILTDSGGLQEEAPSFGIPVLVMRNETERSEAIEYGTVKLVGADEKNIIKYVSKLHDDSTFYNAMSNAVNPYGNGKSVEKILEIIKKNHRSII